ncbi:MAG TPA: peroxiredoxin [Burkholderiales bacterium]|jgi:thioredoxin-dependent peroxiredoxin|nr:peroxiredoxin [Burkholderiales bacterium]
MLKVGEVAPTFDLPDGDMNVVSLSAYLGVNNVVLYFYPKDDTPGCTREAIDFSDREDDFLDLDTVVLGVSMDDCMSHGAFRDKHGLAVKLLADTEGEVCEKYGVLQEKKVEGKGERRGILRSTFVIDKSGALRNVLYGVNARGHAADVLNLVKELK